jgi:hypothetical protein
MKRRSFIFQLVSALFVLKLSPRTAWAFAGAKEPGTLKKVSDDFEWDSRKALRKAIKESKIDQFLQ